MATRSSGTGNAGKKDAPKLGQTASEEHAAAVAMAESARPNPRITPVQGPQPELSVAPIDVTPKPPPEAPERDKRFPRLRRVAFKAPVLFDYGSRPVGDIDITSAFYTDHVSKRKVYARLEFAEWHGQLVVLVERLHPNSKTGYALHRIPFDQIGLFTTFEDNPEFDTPVISVNERATPVLNLGGQP